MVFFNAPFVRLGGLVTFQLTPRDALLCIERFPCSPGGTTVELPSGFHTARISRFGFQPERRKFIVSHDKKITIRVKLEEHADRDSDGFPDSIDRCPDVYGLYEGCPKPDFQTMFMMKYDELTEYMETEPFSFAVSGIGYINRSPANKRFHNFMSSFSGGLSGGLNNYQGITLGNIYQVSARGFMTQVELGQWVSGVKYRRPDTMTINTKHDRYLIWYDSLYNIDPAVFFPSTAASIGFKYRLHNYSVGYSLGFQWEDIVLDEIEKIGADGTSTADFRRVIFNNDWWFHEIMLEADLFMDTFMTPSLYAKFKFPFGPTMRTKWHVFQMGLQFRMRPVNWKGRV
jgi:hypothetical protein